MSRLRPLITGENHTQSRDGTPVRSVFTFLYDTPFVATMFDVASHFRKVEVRLIGRELHRMRRRRQVENREKRNGDEKRQPGPRDVTSEREFKRRGAVAGNTRYALKRLRFERCIIIDSVYSRAPCVCNIYIHMYFEHTNINIYI